MQNDSATPSTETPKTVKFKFGQPWTHRGETYKAGDEVELSAEDAAMLKNDFKADQVAPEKKAPKTSK